MPASAANPVATAHEMPATRLELTPISSDTSARSTTARMRIPSGEYRRNARSAAHSASTMRMVATSGKVAWTPPTVHRWRGNRLCGVSVVAEPHTTPARPNSAMRSPMVATIWTTVPAARNWRNSAAWRSHPKAGATTPTTSSSATTVGRCQRWS